MNALIGTCASKSCCSRNDCSLAKPTVRWAWPFFALALDPFFVLSLFHHERFSRKEMVMAFNLDYAVYLDRVLGGWIGKSIGGTIGARFEGYKGWIEVDPQQLFPETIPPNDDLDLQVLWLKVLEEKGAALTSDDLAQAWLDHCWYPFNEYGTFRRNWQLGIHPPYSGTYDNAFWETGMGCPIRSEIWGYVFPGAPDLAAAYAEKDGTLDHSAQSVGAEKMFAAMAAMAFFVPDVTRLTQMALHYLPQGTTIERLTRAALDAHARGLSLREARELLLALEGNPEACDARINVPFTFLALLYGQNDLQETLLCALRCGYDTDCTLATAGALIGQILGARAIPAHLKEPIGDQLVMGIEYHRPEMTLSALARDTVRVGTLLARELATGTAILNPPELQPLPVSKPLDRPTLRVVYHGLPCAAPGETVTVTVHLESKAPQGGEVLSVEPPAGWHAQPGHVVLGPTSRRVDFQLYADPAMPALSLRNLFTLRWNGQAAQTFGLAGAGLWRFLGAYFDPLPPEDRPEVQRLKWQHHFADLHREYLPEPVPDADVLYQRWSRILGRPAVIIARERRVEIEQLARLEGAYVAYLDRTIISPDAREVYLVVGNNDGYKLYLNGEPVGAVDEQICWAPFNNVHRVRLRQGENHLLVKLIKRGEVLRWTLGIRRTEPRPHHNANDWCVDLADGNPLAG